MIPPDWQLRPPDGVSDPITKALLQLTEERLGAVPVERALVWAVQHQPEAVLAHIASALGLTRLTWLSQEPADLLEQGLEFARRLGTPSAVEDALAAVGFPGVHLHEDTRLFCDGSIFADGTFVAGAHSHWAVFWAVFALASITDEQRAVVTSLVEASKRTASHLGQIYLVDDPAEFGAVSRYRTGPWAPDQLTKLVSWWRGDDPDASVVDSHYASIPDRGSLGGAYVQSSASLRPAVDAVGWTVGPAPSFEEADWLVHNGLAADWAWLVDHEDDDADIWCAIRLQALGNWKSIWTTSRHGNNAGATLAVMANGSLLFELRKAGGSPSSQTSVAGVMQVGHTYRAVTRKRGAVWTCEVEGVQRLNLTMGDPGPGAEHPMTVAHSLTGHVTEFGVRRGTASPRWPDSYLTDHLSRWSYVG